MYRRTIVPIAFTKHFKHFARSKHQDNHWSMIRKKIHPIHKALDHFDDFYKHVFDKDWPSIREGLLSKPKYVAVVNNYGDVEETIAKLEMAGALSVRTLFQLEKQYVQEKLENNRQSRYLNKVWRNRRNEVESVEEAPKEEVEEPSFERLSLEESLKRAEIDHTRLISEAVGMSSPLLTEFIPATKLKGMEDFIPESDYYKYYESNRTLQIRIEPEHDINFPENLHVYCFEYGNFATFPNTKRTLTGVSNYYLMDGGSLLPVLALDLTPKSRVLDMCAAPGGKSLLAIQTLYPDCVICNDVSSSRVKRLLNVMHEFLYDVEERWLQTDRLRITCKDGRNIGYGDFDAVLVDVPCTTDRHSLKENENNIFHSNRIKERLQIPELQSELLYHALTLVKVGGTVVYSTCSLSPIQNDGVVYMTLKRIWEETQLEFVIKDLSAALVQAQCVYKFANRKYVKYGHLVLPLIHQNYGPMYFCKLKRVK